MVQVTFEGQELESPRTLRIRFRKTGALQYISHLDLMRTMTRVMARAHLPIRYTGGYSPKPHLVFSAPLPVGAQSPREFVDVAVLREIDLADVVARLNEGLPADLAVEEAYYATTKLTDAVSAEYVISVRTTGASAALAADCAARLSDRPMTVLKKTKSGEKDVDISGAILQANAIYDEKEDRLVLTVRLAAEGGSFLNPDYIIKYLQKTAGILQGNVYEEWYTVVRTHLFNSSGEDFF
jgi:radical SAM-linked protein